jgi:hypothetical protein
MNRRILQILDNVRYWETCPDDYKKDIESFFKENSQALSQHDVSGTLPELFRNFIRVNHLTSKWEDYLEDNIGNLY